MKTQEGGIRCRLAKGRSFPAMKGSSHYAATGCNRASAARLESPRLPQYADKSGQVWRVLLLQGLQGERRRDEYSKLVQTVLHTFAHVHLQDYHSEHRRAAVQTGPQNAYWKFGRFLVGNGDR